MRWEVEEVGHVPVEAAKTAADLQSLGRRLDKVKIVLVGIHQIQPHFSAPRLWQRGQPRCRRLHGGAADRQSRRDGICCG